MESLVKQLHSDGLLPDAPRYVVGSMQYETIMGSEAYAVSSGKSDRDIYGFCMPPKDYIFPHLAGYIPGFGAGKPPKFDNFEKHHIEVQARGTQYDLAVYGIVRYFQLCMENNPNMIDSLFTPERCVLYITPLGSYVRSHRKKFLNAKAWHSFKGYAYSQMKSIRSGGDLDKMSGKRRELIEKYGYDVKFAYHVVRLMMEVEQILIEGDLDLERNREQLKDIRNGNWKLEDVTEFFKQKELSLEKVYNETKIPYGVKDIEPAVKTILVHCLEMYYGDLNKAVIATGVAENTLRDIRKLLDMAGV